MWRFKLDTPSFVRITTNADVYKYNFNGDMSMYLGVDETCPSKFISGWANGDDKSFDTLLEAGTYYIRQDVVQKSNDEKYIKANPSLLVLIEAQSIPQRTGNAKGTSKETAIRVKNGTTSYGIISGRTSMGTFPVNSVGQQCFRIDVRNKTTLNYTAVFQRYDTLQSMHTKTLKVQNNLGVDLVNTSNYSRNSITGTVDLPCAGTYYIIASSERFASVGMTLSWSDKKVNTSDLKKLTLKVNKIKKGVRKVTGKATKGSSVKIKILTRAFKGKVSTNGKFSIKTKALKKGTRVVVTVSKKGYKTKKVTVKVK